ncbi:acyl-CoA dehydrogenase family protein [Streptomyces sp. NBC_01443]|uniref:acyl-CoA dehydrogenase family protein n=1 Tax=Streptomyces sp. NBC_01443 TaxID=2903868 RepID=UPI00224CE96E|nr:acyl-CoA dehydrogenase family protein [Streptomyces sp. NBC_01443]MCX4628622.1 acyl-CoA dehydrogenase family protein [Streptomyces sp. NBC_01443]
MAASLPVTGADDGLDRLREVLRRTSAEADATGAPVAEALAELRASGILAAGVPIAHGGRGGDALVTNRLVERVAALDPSVAIVLFQHYAVTARIVEWGSPEQQAAVLPRLASGEWLVASAWSEEGAGADKRNVATTADRRGDGWVLDGTKAFVTGAGVADLYLVLARSAGPSGGADGSGGFYGGDGQTFFLVEAANPGLRPGPALDLEGMRGSATGFLELRDCAVPGTAVLGPVGGAARIIAGVRESGATLGAVSAGIAAAAQELATAHATARGLLEHGDTTHCLVGLATQVETVRAVVERAGRRDSGAAGATTLHSKLAATSIAEDVCQEVQRLLGGSGYRRSSPINRLLRDARAVALMGPTNALCRELLRVGRATAAPPEEAAPRLPAVPQPAPAGRPPVPSTPPTREEAMPGATPEPMPDAMPQAVPEATPAVTHVLVGFSAGLLADLDRLLPARSVLVLEEPAVIAARNAGELAARYGCVAELRPAPTQDEERPERLVAAVPRPPALRAVIPAVEYGVVGAAALAEAWDVPGAGTAAARVMRDKALLRGTAGPGGVDQPDWAPAEGPDDVQRFRARHGGSCVLKPANRQASLGVQLLGPADDIHEAWAGTTAADEPKLRVGYSGAARYLVEERLHGPEVSVELLVVDGRPGFVNVTAKSVQDSRHPVETGHVVPAGLPAGTVAALESAMAALVRATGFRSGVLHAEWILHQGRPHLVECAGRLPGDSIDTLIDLAYGGSILGGLLAVLEGRGAPAPRPATAGAAIRFLSAPAGTVTSVDGEEEARTAPGVHTLHVSAVPGTTTRAATSSWERAGFVVATGRDGAEAAANAAHAAGRVAIRTGAGGAR